MAKPFEVVSEFEPTGDQPQAIEAIAKQIETDRPATTLLGATGTGKTFTMAHVIEKVQRPALILSHNKTLAAQLYEEFKDLFPENAVSYFVSYYDYYQPEAYIPQRDIYIEKDSSRNDDLDRLRLAATSNLLSRRDTIVVASVSCIFGLGSPGAYSEKVFTITTGQEIDRREFLLALADMQVPACKACGGVLMPDVVFFGGTVPRDRVNRITEAIESADALLVAGSSLMVFSGFRFCRQAAKLGKPIVIINRGQTRADELAALKLEADAGEVLDQLASSLGNASASVS